MVTYITQASMTKGVPKYLENKLVTGRAMVVYKIRKFVEKELKDADKEPAWKQYMN